MKRILFVDYSNLIARSFYAFNVYTEAGKHSGLFYGSLRLIYSKIRQYNITDVCVFLDKKPYWKTSIFPEYKQGRKGFQTGDLTEDFNENAKDLEFLLPHLQFNVISFPSFEADDLIAAFVHKFKDSCEKIYMYSGDHDLYQLVDDKVYFIKAQSGDKDILVTPENVEEMIETTSEEYTNVLALSGDKGDGVPSIFAIREGNSETGYSWKNPKIIMSEGKIIKLLKNNKLENLLSGKVNPAKGVGKATEELFINISDIHKENFERNFKLVNLRNGGEKMKVIEENHSIFKLDKKIFNEELLKEMLKKYECKSIKIDSKFPYYYVTDNTNKPVIDRNSFLSLLKKNK